MPDPDVLTLDVAPSRSVCDCKNSGVARPVVMRRCMRKAAIAMCALGVAGGLLVWRESRADAILSRIHHGMLVCASGDAATATLVGPLTSGGAMSAILPGAVANAAIPTDLLTGRQYAPAMVRLDVFESTAGLLTVGGGTQSLSSALSASRKGRKLVMLSLHGATPKHVAQAIRAADMRHHVILAATNDAEARTAMAADGGMMIALPVRSAREEQHARRLVGSHRFAAYLPASATPELFALAHHDAEAVIADGPTTPDDPAKLQALLDEPVDIIVTDQPVRFAETMTGEDAARQ
ncbi:hypothetical protein J2D73_07585 [Acetobacter sacchari]|uniref:Uncharacterized protein n=1 Tax=Acetobacter sacchari TaxID=2661687 RepID=A0ABS3LUT3_9PROT|nr:hypothetical protein [Acetobacter sacchari]MBO1359654.1 hypothetical protein [Acetobacter sacchari]